MKLAIVTPVSRPENVPKVGASIAAALDRCDSVRVQWWRSFAAAIPLAQVHRAIAAAGAYPFPCVTMQAKVAGIGGCPERNLVLDELGEGDGWLHFLDDDNLMPDAYLQLLAMQLANYPGKALMLDQVDRYGAIRCLAAPQNMRPCAVDTAQGVIPLDLVGATRWNAASATNDGEWYAALYAKAPERFAFLRSPTVLYNALR